MQSWVVRDRTGWFSPFDGYLFRQTVPSFSLTFVAVTFFNFRTLYFAHSISIEAGIQWKTPGRG